MQPKQLVSVAAVATLLATAVGLALSAANGYFIRVDVIQLTSIELAGNFIVVATTLLIIAAAARLMRIPMSRLPIASGLASAMAPVALVLLWRHREAPYITALSVAALIILAITAIEYRFVKSTQVRPLGMVCTLVCGAAILWLTTIPFPGREGIGPGSAPAASGVVDPRPNLLFIVLDTLRADHMSTYGYPRVTTPWLDEFAMTATVFENAAATSSYTLPTHATLFTGLYPESHGAVESGSDAGISLQDLQLNLDWAKVLPLSDDATTLAELLRAAGYQTAAMCANSAYLARAFNLDQGFDTYIDTPGTNDAWRPLGLSLTRRIPMPAKWRFERMLHSSERPYLLAGEINELASMWLATRSAAPYFLFLNYMEPHAPYLPLPGYRNAYPRAYERITADRASANRGESTVSAEQTQTLIDAYDAEIRSLDDRLRELFTRMERWGLLENTHVVIVSDHGEAFGEHGRFDHAQSVFEEEIHVPLIVRTPGQTTAERVARRVSTADVMPTLLAWLGVSSEQPIEGSDLFGEARRQPVVSYLGPYERAYTEHAVYDGDLKLILRSDAEPRLFDLSVDTGEQRDLVAERPADVARLMDVFREFDGRGGPRYRHEQFVTDPETMERLNSLGYGDGGSSEAQDNPR